MRSDGIGYESFGHARTAHNERNVNVFLETAFLSGLETMLTDVITVVARVENVSVVNDASLVEARNYTLNDIVDCLQSAETVSIEMIIEIDISSTCRGSFETHDTPLA